MALDSITLYHLLRELRPQLIGTRLDRIAQPEKEEIHLHLRSPGRNMRLLLNASSTQARLHLTEHSKRNPATAPMFCMILRKHLESGKLIDLRQNNLERIITLVIQNYNERGDLQNYHLHLEIMGKHSNLILVNPETNTILDGIKRYSHIVSRHREVLPGKTYLPPPPQEKLDPVFQEEIWVQHVFQQDLNKKIVSILLDTFSGMSPELAREIVARAGLEENTILDNCGEIDLSRLYQAYCFFFLNMDQTVLEPCIYYQSKKNTTVPATFTFIPYEQYAGLPLEKTASLNEAISLYYHKKTRHNTTEAKRGSLRKLVNDHYNRLSKKHEVFISTIAKAEKGLEYQKLGELLTANLYRLPAHQREVTLEDYTDPEYKPITITLDPALDGIQNAQRYFKLYNKAKSAINKTVPLLETTKEEMAYLQGLLLNIEQAATYEELNEIHQELSEQGYISAKHSAKTATSLKAAAKAKKKEQEKQSVPHRYYSETGRLIIVGRNNRQNDRMTWREAKPTDLWLHVKNIPGSHVIVPLNDNEEFPDDATLEDAATLAVYYSQARGSSQVPVDYTHVKHIKKPKGARPGMVIYHQNWSLIITPKAEDIERLLSSEQATEN
ncbi:MAG: fibronectin/fibrinogen-binding protein [Peptococcaceae bacterium]|jgi:predicted ribosome quality control (RQC) complex YloA/Tae2 family protein|nr:fibronectin/fibrinogen-binding protein [Peptococcaceae bacterium]